MAQRQYFLCLPFGYRTEKGNKWPREIAAWGRCKDPKAPRKHGPYYQLSYTWRARTWLRIPVRTHFQFMTSPRFRAASMAIARFSFSLLWPVNFLGSGRNDAPVLHDLSL